MIHCWMPVCDYHIATPIRTRRDAQILGLLELGRCAELDFIVSMYQNLELIHASIMVSYA